MKTFTVCSENNAWVALFCSMKSITCVVSLLYSDGVELHLSCLVKTFPCCIDLQNCPDDFMKLFTENTQEQKNLSTLNIVSI